MSKSVVTSVLEVGSAAAITTGVAMSSASLGLVAGGAFGLLFAWRISR